MSEFTRVYFSSRYKALKSSTNICETKITTIVYNRSLIRSPLTAEGLKLSFISFHIEPSLCVYLARPVFCRCLLRLVLSFFPARAVEHHPLRLFFRAGDTMNYL